MLHPSQMGRGSEVQIIDGHNLLRLKTAPDRPANGAFDNRTWTLPACGQCPAAGFRYL